MSKSRNYYICDWIGIVHVILTMLIVTFIYLHENLWTSLAPKTISVTDTQQATQYKSYPITIVTSYFKLDSNKSKHAFNDYDKWIRNWLSMVKHPIVIYTDQYDYISSIRPMNNHEIEYPTLIVNISLSSLPVYQKYYNKTYIKHHQYLDMEKDIHSPEFMSFGHQNHIL